MEKFTVTVTLPVPAKTIYKAWLDAKTHAAIIDSNASIKPIVGDSFEMWDGYITGQNLELDADNRILQAWRTTEFPDDAPDSLVEITFKEKDGKTTVSLQHSNLQKGDGEKYKKGWKEHYFAPMKDFFRK